MKAFILSLIIFVSCTKNAEVTKNAVGIEIKPVQMEISHLNEITWKVGLRKEEEVSQSITFIIDLPKIDSSDLDYLTAHKGIDAWILRLVVDRGSKSQDLGSLYALYKPIKRKRGAQGKGTITSVTMKIFYAAAFASERFRAFKCPAFEHNKKISKMSVMGENEKFGLTITQAIPYNEKSHLVELTPSAFNAGNSMIGNYFIEIAPYDTKKRLIHSSFKRLPMYINVGEEETIRINSCDGIHPELNPT